MKDKEENIDKFIKKSVAYYDVQYDDAHWEAMEKRLDAEMPVVVPSGSAMHFPTIIISVVGGMILMLGILWMSGVFENGEAVSTRTEGNEAVRENQSFTENNSNTQNGYTNSVLQNDVEGGNSLESIKSQVSPNSSSNENGGLMTEMQNDPLSARRKIYYMSMTGIDAKGFDFAIPVDNDFKNIEAYDLNQGSESQLPKEFEETVFPSKRNKVQFGVSLGFAPDINGVNEPIGKSVSGLAGLQLFATYNQRIGIMTGVYYSKKKYNTEGENYFPPTGYWNRFTNGVIPAEVIGTSAVIDIPVNLTYNWNPNKKLQFVTGLGVSSYFILNEDCWYRFDQSNPGSAYGWDTEEMVKQMWGVGNVSVGILWYLNPKINIRVEPYLKVPFSDFGWGKIDLYSTGTLVSLQYTFN